MTEFPFVDFNQYDSREELYEYFLSNVAGSRTSSWPFLRDSARTCLLQSISKTSKILDSYSRNIEKSMPVGERWLALWLQYSCFLNGLILSTIILSSFAVESFVRHCYTTLIRNKDNFKIELNDFDKLSAIRRINLLIEKAEARKITNTLYKDIKELILYRNDIAHDDPLLFLHSGELEQVKRGKKKIVNEKSRIYPLLPTENMPLNLSHALKAVSTHDLFISHVINSAKNENFQFFKEEIELTGIKLILAGLPRNISFDYIKSLSEAWIEKISEELDIKELKDVQNFLKVLKRKVQIKRGK